MTLRFFCPGKPEPQGSSRAFVRGNRAVVTSDNPRLHGWRRDVGVCAKVAMTAQGVPTPPGGLEGTFGVHCVFLMPPPKSLDRARRADPGRIPCGVRPDVDKLLRGILDSLTGLVFTDDSRVVVVVAEKFYPGPSEEPGVSVVVTRYDKERPCLP